MSILDKIHILYEYKKLRWIVEKSLGLFKSLFSTCLLHFSELVSALALNIYNKRGEQAILEVTESEVRFLVIFLVASFKYWSFYVF